MAGSLKDRVSATNTPSRGLWLHHRWEAHARPEIHAGASLRLSARGEPEALPRPLGGVFSTKITVRGTRIPSLVPPAPGIPAWSGSHCPLDRQRLLIEMLAPWPKESRLEFLLKSLETRRMVLRPTEDGIREVVGQAFIQGASKARPGRGWG